VQDTTEEGQLARLILGYRRTTANENPPGVQLLGSSSWMR
jgi:hypothetical protein